MGCHLSSQTLRPSKIYPKRETQYNLQELYNEALKLCALNYYAKALDSLNRIKQLYPVFPFIDQNIQQCQRLIKAKEASDLGKQYFQSENYDSALNQLNLAKKLESRFPNIEQSIKLCQSMRSAKRDYEQGGILQSKGQFKEALQKYENIEKSQQNYKDVRSQIAWCKTQIELKTSKIEFDQKLVKEQEKYRKLFDQMLKERQKWQAELVEVKKQVQQLLQNQQQQEKEKITEPQQESKREQPQSDFPEQKQKTSIMVEINIGPLNKVPIYFICIKTPKCKEWKENSRFRHSKCKTAAYFHADGTISCLQNCDTYTIKNALFSCQTNFVCQNDGKINQDEYEQISDMRQLADFVEDCLIQDNHAEASQNEFRVQVGIGALMLYL